jgi:type I restriction enzyme S subunit
MHLFNQIAQKPNIVYVSPSMIDDRIEAIYYKQQYLDADEKIVSFDTGYVFLKDLCSKITDGTHKTPNYTTKGLKFISSKNVSEDGIDFENVKYISKEEHHEISKRCKVEAEDILLTKVGRIGYAKIVPANVPDFSIFVSVALLKLKGNMDNAFIEVFLNSKYGRIQSEKLAKGSNQPDFHLEDIAEIKIPIPSPEIQKYIGDKVRKAEELREEAKRLIKEAEEILYSQLKQEQYLEKQKSIVNKYIWLSDKEVDTRIDSQYYKPNYILYKHILNKNGIKTKKIKDVVKDIRTGTTPQSNYITKDEKRIKFLRVNNLGYCMLEKDDMLYVNDKYDEKKLKIIPKGDILVSIAGTLGRSSVVDMDNCTTNQNIAALTLKNINFIKPYYLSLYLNSYFGYLSLDTISTQATVKYINNELLGEIEIPLIDIDIQLIIEEKIARYKNKINKSKQLIQEAKQDVEDLIEGNFDMSKIKVNN